MLNYDVEKCEYTPEEGMSFHDFICELYKEAVALGRQVHGNFHDFHVVINQHTNAKDFDAFEQNYRDHVKRVTKTKAPVEKELDKDSLIHNIIDRAMEKKDRYVNLVFSEDVVSVYIYPLGEKEVNDNE